MRACRHMLTKRFATGRSCSGNEPVIELVLGRSERSSANVQFKSICQARHKLIVTTAGAWANGCLGRCRNEIECASQICRLVSDSAESDEYLAAR